MRSASVVVVLALAEWRRCIVQPLKAACRVC